MLPIPLNEKAEEINPAILFTVIIQKGAQINPSMQQAIPNNPDNKYPSIIVIPNRKNIPNWLIDAYSFAVKRVKENPPFASRGERKNQ